MYDFFADYPYLEKINMLKAYQKTNPISLILRCIFVVLLITLIGYTFCFQITVDKPTSKTIPRSNNSSDIKKLTSIIEKYANCKDIGLNSSEQTSNIYELIAHEFLNDQRKYMKDRNFSTPAQVLHYFYHKELPQFNFEAELQLQSNYTPHDPLYSSLFNDPIHAIRRGYGLEGSIFVAILPSFQSDCAITVEHLFKNALFPSNIFVGVLDAVANESRRCIPVSFEQSFIQEKMGFTVVDNIRTRRIHNFELSEEDAGNEDFILSPEDPMRYSLLQLYRGESYILFIRSGTILSQGWDWIIKLMYLYEGGDNNDIVLTSSTPKLIDIVVESINNFSISLITNMSTSSDNASFPYEKKEWSLERLERIMTACAACAFLLVTPQECLTPRVKNILTQSLSSVPYNFSQFAFSLMEGQSPLNNLQINFSGDSLNGFSNSVANVAVNGDPKKMERNSNIVDSMENFFSVLPMCDLFDDTKKILYKSHLELCWLTFFNDTLIATALSALQLTVFAPVVNQNVPGLLEIIGFPRNSDAMSDMSYIYKQTVHLDSFQQTIVSLDFLFSKAEAFYDIPDELRLFFPGANKRVKRTDSVMFDPYLPALSTSEAEILISAKLFTSGWISKVITEPLTFSVRKVNKKGMLNCSEKKKSDLKSMRKETTKRLSKLFSTHGNMTNCGISKSFLMGQRRLLKDFYSLININESDLIDRVSYGI